MTSKLPESIPSAMSSAKTSEIGDESDAESVKETVADDGTNSNVDDTISSEGSNTELRSPLSTTRQNRCQFSLPPSSTDLPFESVEDAFNAAVVYEIVLRFSFKLRLSPFLFEEFSAALCCQSESSSLLNEIFSSLLKFVIRDDIHEGNTFCGRLAVHDGRESVAITFYGTDCLTWPEVCRMYILGRSKNESVLQIVQSPNFPFVSCRERLLVLRELTDFVLEVNSILKLYLIFSIFMIFCRAT